MIIITKIPRCYLIHLLFDNDHFSYKKTDFYLTLTLIVSLFYFIYLRVSSINKKKLARTSSINRKWMKKAPRKINEKMSLQEDILRSGTLNLMNWFKKLLNFSHTAYLFWKQVVIKCSILVFPAYWFLFFINLCFLIRI